MTRAEQSEQTQRFIWSVQAKIEHAYNVMEQWVRAQEDAGAYVAPENRKELEKCRKALSRCYDQLGESAKELQPFIDVPASVKYMEVGDV